MPGGPIIKVFPLVCIAPSMARFVKFGKNQTILLDKAKAWETVLNFLEVITLPSGIPYLFPTSLCKSNPKSAT